MQNFIDPSLLAANAAKTDVELVMRYFDDTELSEKKDALATAQLQLHQRREVIASISDILNTQLSEDQITNDTTYKDAIQDWTKNMRTIEGISSIKTLKKYIEALTTEIYIGYTEVNETVYHMHDYDDRMVGIYSKDGNLIRSRMLRPDERQASIFGMAKTN